MAKQIVMDTTGDTRHEFDPADVHAVAEAFARFEALTSEGFTAAVRRGRELQNSFATSILLRRDAVLPAIARWLVENCGR